ncbi:MAG: calcium-binding protein [bacterium]
MTDFSAYLNMSDLDGTNGFTLTRTSTTNERQGGTVSMVGDITGDGITDYFVGSPTANTDTGLGFLIEGNTLINAAASYEIGSIATSTISGTTAGWRATQDVAGIGDVNNDGIDDMLISASHSTAGGNTLAGKSYVVFGSSTLASNISLESLSPSQGFAINGITASDFSGFHVSAAGDINADGIDDILIGAQNAEPGSGANSFQGEAYIVYGANNLGSTGDIDLSGLNGTNGFIINGATGGDAAGSGVSAIGDYNGDGVDDFSVGAYLRDVGGSTSGSTYIIYGSSTIASGGAFDLSGIDGTNGFELTGNGNNDRSGAPVAAAGDINGDGLADVITGAAGVPGLQGRSHIIFGGTNTGSGAVAAFSTASLNSTNGVSFIGNDVSSQTGFDVAGIGDFNSDGFDDVLVGAPYAEPFVNGSFQTDGGEAYIIFGGTSLGTSGTMSVADLNGDNGFALNGLASGDNLGYSVSGGSDINGDGYADVIIGAPGLEDGANVDRGGAYVIFGYDVGGGSDIIRGRSADDIIDGLGGDDTIYGYTGNDTIDGDGGNNTIYGGDGNDILKAAGGVDVFFGGDGSDDIRGGSGNDELSGGAGNDTLYGQSGIDTINGDGDQDIIYGGVGNDIIYGGDGVDTLYGQGGEDTIYGDAGDDTLIGGAANDTLHGGTEDDILQGAQNTDILRGDDGLDDLYGGNQRDYLYGNRGEDRLYGQQGTDRLNGGADNDTLNGGDNQDEFVFALNYDIDTITDFTDNIDSIELNSNLWGGGLTVAQVISTYGSMAGSTAILDFGTDELRVLNTVLSALENDIVIV